jgi:hypothetical protein
MSLAVIYFHLSTIEIRLLHIGIQSMLGSETGTGRLAMHITRYLTASKIIHVIPASMQLYDSSFATSQLFFENSFAICGI